MGIVYFEATSYDFCQRNRKAL